MGGVFSTPWKDKDAYKLLLRIPDDSQRNGDISTCILGFSNREK
jgi:hypothetical protein